MKASFKEKANKKIDYHFTQINIKFREIRAKIESKISPESKGRLESESSTFFCGERGGKFISNINLFFSSYNCYFIRFNFKLLHMPKYEIF